MYDPDFDPGASDEQANMAMLVSVIVAGVFYAIFWVLGIF